MNVRTFLVLGASALFGLCLAVMFVGSTAAQDQVKPPVIQWEYKEYPSARSGDDSLAVDLAQFNKFGVDGWELCGVRAFPYSAVFYLKRPQASP